jgi:hypothetical protein
LSESGVLGIPKRKRLLLLRKNWSSSNNLKISPQHKEGVNCLVDDNAPKVTRLMDENSLWRIKEACVGGYGELGLLEKVVKRQRRAHLRARMTCGKRL